MKDNNKRVPWYMTECDEYGDTEFLNDLYNCRNRCFEYLRHPEFLERAKKIDEQYGTNYHATYLKLISDYENRFFELPDISVGDIAAVSRSIIKDGNRDVSSFDIEVNSKLELDPREVVVYWFNRMVSQVSGDSILLSAIANSLKPSDENRLYRKGSEQKARMNQFRRRLLDCQIIESLDEWVSENTLKSALKGLYETDPIKVAYREHKDIKTYAEWFNTIPLI